MNCQRIPKLLPEQCPAASKGFQFRPCGFGKKTAAAAAVFGDVVINRCQQVFRQRAVGEIFTRMRDGDMTGTVGMDEALMAALTAVAYPAFLQ